MTRNLLGALFLTLFLLTLLAVYSFGMQPERASAVDKLKPNLLLKNKLIGGDPYYAKVVNEGGSSYDNPRVFYTETGSKGVVTPDTAIGIEVGSTTYDYQSNSRTKRQIAWRNDHVIHFAWMQKNTDQQGPGTYRMTTYQLYDPTTPGALGWNPINNYGGKGIHIETERSGYCGIDILPVDDEGEIVGRAVVYNHYDLTGGISGNLVYSPTYWPDAGPGQGSFSAFKHSVPAELRQGAPTAEFVWPYISTQVYNGDTIMHAVCRRFDPTRDFTQMRYFRRVGPVDPNTGDPPGSAIEWSGFIVDTIATISIHQSREHSPSCPTVIK
jgi:hypothetical protein